MQCQCHAHVHALNVCIPCSTCACMYLPRCPFPQTHPKRLFWWSQSILLAAMTWVLMELSRVQSSTCNHRTSFEHRPSPSTNILTRAVLAQISHANARISDSGCCPSACQVIPRRKAIVLRPSGKTDPSVLLFMLPWMQYVAPFSINLYLISIKLSI